MQVVFSDWTLAENKAAFSANSSEQLRQELEYSVLLDSAGWFSDNLRFGCIRCAPFLTRAKLQLSPMHPSQLLEGEEQLPHLAVRHRHLAYSLLNTTIQNFKQQSFIAFLSSSTLIPTAKNLVHLISYPDDFMQYKRP